ncbi:NUDIX domain-containing protein [Tepidiphilus baoligensis]|uniref:NUDIX domain-containing protein n=1 Tax=Tepidiphilus baoligensis TaxID=2698687 RepID=A0ABX1QMU6_9PROT|nr:NUDIX domain-containing protein [Tepidiphilus baoligensis]NMH17207.1 NUDIX domain-containing protein [Tepidiphilus baoligensis]
MPVRFAIPTAVQVRLFDEQGRVLFLRRAGTGFFDGFWSLPGGHVENGESLRQAAVRELAEELGIKVGAQALTPVAVVHRASDTNRIEFLFDAFQWQGEVHIAEPHRCDGLRWDDPARPPEPFAPYLSAIWPRLGRQWLFEVGWGEESADAMARAGAAPR